MDKRYSTITLSDGTVKRVSKKIIQKAGAPPRNTADIDSDFASDHRRMELVLNKTGWSPSAESWYDLLEITPDYLIQKCAEKGLTDQETQQVISNWGKRLYNVSYPPPTGTAILGDQKFNPNIPEDVKSAHEQYLNTTVKETERKAYQDCKLSYRKSELPQMNKAFCEGFMCNPVPYTKPITNEETLNEALHLDTMPEHKKNTIKSCFRSGYTCNDIDYPATYDYTRFKYISNGGSGDCLFIAFSNYMTLVQQMGGIFPDPMADNTGLPVGVKPHDNIELAHKFRLDTVQWLRDNLDSLLPRQNYPIKQELALLALETDPLVNVVNNDEKTRILEDFIRRHPNEAAILKLQLQTSPLKNKDKLLQIFRNVDGFLNNLTGVELEVTEAALNMIMSVYSLAYLDAMSKKSTYGGQPEIMALSIINHVNIIVLQRHNGVLAHNSGYNVKDPRGTVYIFHNRSVKGIGGLHYEIMFPATAATAPSTSPSSSRARVTEPSQPQNIRSKFTKSDIDVLVKIGFRVASPTLLSVNKYLSGLSGTKLDDVFYILFQHKMREMDTLSLSSATKNILYDFINHRLDDLSIDMRNTFLLSMPSLSLRAAAEDLENWDEPGIIDQQLSDIFAKHVNKLTRKGELSKSNPYSNVSETTISGRLRYVLADFLNEPSNPVQVDDLLSMTITDMYEIANNLIDTPKATHVHDFFFTEFMKNFFFMTVPLVSIISQQPPPIPGVNYGTDLQAIVDIINIFNEYIDLDDN